MREESVWAKPWKPRPSLGKKIIYIVDVKHDVYIPLYVLKLGRIQTSCFTYEMRRKFSLPNTFHEGRQVLLGAGATTTSTSMTARARQSDTVPPAGATGRGSGRCGIACCVRALTPVRVLGKIWDTYVDAMLRATKTHPVGIKAQPSASEALWQKGHSIARPSNPFFFVLVRAAPVSSSSRE
jgi:hypothetical protein